MLQLTPDTIRIVDFYDDGKDARHFIFEPVNFEHQTKAQIGQFFMLFVPGAGLAPFTYTSLPDQHGRFAALVRKVGSLTERLFQLEKSAVLGYTGPHGTGWPLKSIEKVDDILMVAGGCGLAPLAATVDYLIDRGKASQLSLIYGSKDKQSQVLSIERNRWKSKVLLFETLNHQGDSHHMGVPTEHIKDVLQKHDRNPQLVLTCGPEGMMRAVASTCQKMGMTADAIWLSIERRMRCGVGLCGHCYLVNTYACKQGPTYRYDKLLALEEKTASFDRHSGQFQYC